MRPLPDVLVLSLIAVLLPPADPDPPTPGGREVVVCHGPRGRAASRALTIEREDLAAHLMHGDFEPIAGSCSLVPLLVACGGARGLACPAGAACMDLPGDGCDPPGACPGICMALGPPLTTAPVACREGLFPVDDPRDGCDPAACGGPCPVVCASPLRLM
jgi:hypothetical protein